ncbi:MAG: hypothetical protein AAF799_36140 [Myxococcota bacterium]
MHTLNGNSRSSRARSFGRGLTLALALCTAFGCDSKEGGDAKKGDDKAADAKKEAGASEKGKKVEAKVTELKAELEKGEDIKYGCAGNLAQYKELASSSNADDKKAYESLVAVCFVEAPRKMIAGLQAKMEKGELGTFDTVDLQTVIESEDFPKDGEPAKVAAEAKAFLEVQVPMYNLGKELEVAKKEKAEGKTVSMGCIKAGQVVEKSGKAIEADEKGKAMIASFKETCPE